MDPGEGGERMSEKDLCQRCLMRWREGLSCEIPPWVHCHHDQPGPEPAKEEVKPCKWCEKWKIFMSWRWSSSCVELQEAIHYLITIGKYMQECPVCDARLSRRAQ